MDKSKGCAGLKLVCLLVVVGALNWGLVGLAGFFTDGGNWNVVNLLLGNWEWLENLVYVLVGVGGLVKLFGCPCKKCKKDGVGGGCCGGGKCGSEK